MSNTVARRIPIGPVQAYVNHVRLGSPKSSAILNYNYDLAVGQTGDSNLDINARKINERATIQISVADLKVSQLRYAFANAKSLLSNTTILTNNYLADTTQEIRRFDDLVLTGTGTEGVSSTPLIFTSASVVVYSSDYETEYVQGTDYSTDAACSGIFRVTACTGTGIASGAMVHMHYDASTSGSYIRSGGADAVTEDVIELIGKDSAGQYFQFKAWRAVREGAMNLQVNERDVYPGQTLTWRLLGDLTNYVKGSQLFQVFIES